MQTPEAFKEYADLLCSQIRWKMARPAVRREIEAHLADQRDALVKSGMDEDAAAEKAVALMGDPLDAGAELDRIHRPRPAWSIFILTGLLLVTGVLIKLFLTYDADYPAQIGRCILSAIIGCGCLAGAYFIGFTVIGRRPLLVYFGALLAMAAAVIASPSYLGKSYYGVYVSLLLPLAFAALLYKLRGKGMAGLALSAAGAVALCLLCCFVPTFSGIATVLVSSLALLICAGAKDWFGLGRRRTLAAIFAVAALGLALMVIVLGSSSIARRLAAAVDPMSDPQGAGWQPLRIRELIAGARFFGQGAAPAGGEAYLSAPDTDYLLTYLIHDLGWISFILIMAAFAALLFFGFRLCFRQRNMLGRLISLSVMLTLAMQVVTYAVSNLGFPLISPISLPLVSYGGAATVVNMLLIGIMLSVFRMNSLAGDDAPAPGRPVLRKHFSWQDGTLTVSFRRSIDE